MQDSDPRNIPVKNNPIIVPNLLSKKLIIGESTYHVSGIIIPNINAMTTEYIIT
jgi:hypothetical protein